MELDLLGLFAPRFHEAGVRYMVTGSVASVLYGEMRQTMDVDLVVALAAQEVPRIIQAFPEEEFYCPPEEVLRVEAKRLQRGHFNLIHHATGLRADCYLHRSDLLEQWAFAHRRLVDHDGLPVWFAPPELVIVRKLEFFREGQSEKHLRDIRAMLASTEVERPLIEQWIERLALQAEWQLCLV